MISVYDHLPHHFRTTRRTSFQSTVLSCSCWIRCVPTWILLRGQELTVLFLAGPNCFELQDLETAKSFVLCCSSPEIKAEWATSIQDLIKDYQNQRYTAFGQPFCLGTKFVPTLRNPSFLFFSSPLFSSVGSWFCRALRQSLLDKKEIESAGASSNPKERQRKPSLLLPLQKINTPENKGTHPSSSLPSCCHTSLLAFFSL